MSSVTGDHILSTTIRKAKPNISDEGTSRYTFAASFTGTRPREITIDSAKSLLGVFYDWSHFLDAMTNIKNIRFRD